MQSLLIPFFSVRNRAEGLVAPSRCFGTKCWYCRLRGRDFSGAASCWWDLHMEHRHVSIIVCVCKMVFFDG